MPGLEGLPPRRPPDPAPQTASVGVSASRFVRNEGEVIRHNFGWTLVLLVYLIVLGVGF
jgi:lactate permease